MTEKLKFLDVFATRESVLKSIAEYRYMDRLCKALEPMLRETVAKRVDSRIAKKLQSLFDERHPDLKVSRVRYTHLDRLSGWREFQIYIRTMDTDAGWEEYKFSVQETGGNWDVDYTFLSHRMWGSHADFLQEQLPSIPSRVDEFNHHLKALKELSKTAVPGNHNFPVYPLSALFGFYELS